MATLGIGIAHLTIGAHDQVHPKTGKREGAGILSRVYCFASAAQELDDELRTRKGESGHYVY